MANTSEEPPILTIPEVIGINELCRLCGTQCDKLIGIYSVEGVQSDMAGKVNAYLPIKVDESDHLPLQCCWQCTSTLLAWHDLFITSIEVDRKLRSCHFVTGEEDIKSYDTNEGVLVVGNEESLLVEEPSSLSMQINEATEPAEIIIENVEVADPYTMGDSIAVKEELELSKCELSGSFSDGEEPEKMFHFACTYCHSLFISKSDIEVHLNKEHKTQICEKLEEQTSSVKEAQQKQGRRGKHAIRHPLMKIDQEQVKAAKLEVDGRIFYKCSQCGKILHSVYTFMWHMRIHTGERPYECNLCKRQFRVSQGLVRHLKETHEGVKNFSCDICKRSFATKRNVEEHRRIHTNERPYICATCGKAFKQKASLFVHNRSHSNDFPFTCPECPQKFRTKPVLLLHVTKHTGEKPFPCDVCGRQFRLKYELKRHKMIHSEDRPFACSICTQTFRQKRQSTEELSHEQPPSINPTVESPLEQCKICDKTFNSLKALKTHMHMIHSMKFRCRKSEISDSSFSCNWCNKSYTKKHDLSRHLQSKHGQQPSKSINLELLAKCKNGGAYKCDFCSKTFNKASNFLRHRTLHTNDKAYCCNLCGKNFRLSMSLSRHIREVHEGNRSFKCQLCKKGFKNKWSLNEHLNIHGDARPYICDVCGKAFKQKASLYIHKQYHSSEQDFECNVCHKKFTRKHNVKQHILSHLQQKSFICECCGAQFETKRGWGRHCRKCSVSG